MPARKIERIKRSPVTQKVYGRAFRYARDLLLDREALDEMRVGRSPFAHIDAETIAQRAYVDGYKAAIEDLNKEGLP